MAERSNIIKLIYFNAYLFILHINPDPSLLHLMSSLHTHLNLPNVSLLWSFKTLCGQFLCVFSIHLLTHFFMYLSYLLCYDTLLNAMLKYVVYENKRGDIKK